MYKENDDIFETVRNEYLIKIQEKVFSEYKKRYGVTVPDNIIKILNLLNEMNSVFNELRILRQINTYINDISNSKKDISEQIDHLKAINEVIKAVKSCHLEDRRSDLLLALDDLNLIDNDISNYLKSI